MAYSKANAITVNSVSLPNLYVSFCCLIICEDKLIKQLYFLEDETAKNMCLTQTITRSYVTIDI